MNPAVTQVPKDTGNGAPGVAPGGEAGNLPAPQPTGPTVTWKHPAVLIGGGAVVITTGLVLYNAVQQRDRRRLEEALAAQEDQP